MVMPTMPPTHECVVETGISRYDASSSQMPTAMITHVMPYMSRPGLSSKQSTSAMPLRIRFRHLRAHRDGSEELKDGRE